MAAIVGIFIVAIVKAIVPVFRLTSGTNFEVYVQDPILYTVGIWRSEGYGSGSRRVRRRQNDGRVCPAGRFTGPLIKEALIKA
jgi:hypothetical protein